ncbi:pyrroloquinoline quinone biosynthesis protein PqqB [Xanthobacter dioxanivorans]|uniref:Coenzyme PQQ synthesis protein B n=1 Tax=Xanthobacter dioxanivorans TaxID=2528964 RepID=A0A974SJ96_9HYPH|nr:pyrroloquinoline quinone biosynthesis protein PqqB [Xanthobacter dioxanivorans]QRG08171.1 pyrroloquinoline quinone biosynthesis protein PqqB [Xanthobacter dioxanivorans]
MQVIVLGSAAGGGVPQWNCRCPVCQLAWSGDPRVEPRTQSSIAVSAGGGAWVLLNASPDLRSQIAATPALQPKSGDRDSPIRAVVLTNGDIDHIAGLLTLRESQPFDLFGTKDTLGLLRQNQVFDVVAPAFVPRRAAEFGVPFAPAPGLEMEFFTVPGKVPLWREDAALVIGEESGSTVGVTVTANGRRLVYVPGCAAVTPALRARMSGADLLFFDGTLYRDDEMITAGIGTKTGARMGHLSMSGAGGTVALLADVEVGRRVFIHINNTNPALVDGSQERRTVEAAGWTVARDGMEFSL